MQQVNIEEAKAQLPELIISAVGGEEVIITQNEQPVVKLVSLVQPKPRSQIGSAKGFVEIADDFDAPLEYFAAYVS